MAVLASAWFMIEGYLIPYGLVKWFYLSFYINPVFLIPCQIFLWFRILRGWPVAVLILCFDIFCLLALPVLRLSKSAAVSCFSLLGITRGPPDMESHPEPEHHELVRSRFRSQIPGTQVETPVVHSFSFSCAASIPYQVIMFPVPILSSDDEDDDEDDDDDDEDGDFKEAQMYLEHDPDTDIKLIEFNPQPQPYFTSLPDPPSSWSEHISAFSGSENESSDIGTGRFYPSLGYDDPSHGFSYSSPEEDEQPCMDFNGYLSSRYGLPQVDLSTPYGFPEADSRTPYGLPEVEWVEILPHAASSNSTEDKDTEIEVNDHFPPRCSSSSLSSSELEWSEHQSSQFLPPELDEHSEPVDSSSNPAEEVEPINFSSNPPPEVEPVNNIRSNPPPEVEPVNNIRSNPPPEVQPVNIRSNPLPEVEPVNFRSNEVRETDPVSFSSIPVRQVEEPVTPVRRGEPVNRVRQERADTRGDSDPFYRNYEERMRWFDLLNTERSNGIIAIQEQTPEHAGSLNSLETVDFSNLTLWGKATKSRLLKSLEGDIELVYVAQTCLSWQALHHQFRKVEELSRSNSRRGFFFHNVVGDFQNFQVQMERFMEEEFKSEGRYVKYVCERKIYKKLLQVPELLGFGADVKKSRDKVVLNPKEVLKAIEKCIDTFHRFLKADKEKSGVKFKSSFWTVSYPVEDPRDLMLLNDLNKRLQQKKMQLEVLQGKKKKKKFWMRNTPTAPLGESQRREILFTEIDLKLVKRVLKMATISSAQLQWCRQKLDSITFSNRKVMRVDSCPFFPNS